MLRVSLLLMALLALPLKAATVTNLYQAQVVLPDTDRQSEQAARQQALEQVLVKVSGQSSVVGNDVIRKALGSSNQYVSQMGYGRLNGQQTLELAFEPARIRSLLSQAKASYWNAQRPSILVWLVQEQNRSRDIIWDQSDNPLLVQLEDNADRRGLPVMMPIGDFEDVTAISIPDLWGGFVQPVAKASLRYQPGAVLIVRARQQGQDQYDLSWQLFTEPADQMDSAQSAPVEGRLSGTAAGAIQQMTDQIADQLGARYAIPLGGDTNDQLSVVVGNIHSAEDFFTLERMITHLSSVAAVNAYRIQGEQVEFSVQLLSTEDVFQRELSQDSRLSAVTAPLDEQERMDTDNVVEGGVIQPSQFSAPVDSSSDESAAPQQVAPAAVKPAKQVMQFEWHVPAATTVAI
ncbi:hypothetical protein ABT56_08660 [Photobacterium aquae]|uniref:DUF2066 domain-containing protein n=1 Tax=Photobacterium aquae TaxID=1195763 RepID=A0A0J1H3W6_9GAMM|nr:DUF2066 domain-containing protein [Photobacterium aquae]KLV06445.1 hypothetical protein ABT56_08660 [Photobacterium aquae]